MIWTNFNFGVEFELHKNNHRALLFYKRKKKKYQAINNNVKMNSSFNLLYLVILRY